MNNHLEIHQDPESLRTELAHAYAEFESSFRRRHPYWWWGTLLAPVVVTAMVLLLIGLTRGWTTAGNFVSHALFTFFMLGRFVILMGMEKENIMEGWNITLTPAELFGLVTYMDFMTALFVSFHMGILFRLPYVGPKLGMLVWDGQSLMRSQPWIRRMAFWGLIAFVIFPSSTTGSIGGSIFGRLLGLSRQAIVIAVLLGSLIGNSLMYGCANFINQYVNPQNVWFKVVGIAIVVVLVLLLEYRYHRIKKRQLLQAQADPSKLNDGNQV